MINDDILFLIKATMFVLFLNLLLWPHPVDESQNHSQIGPVDTEMTGLKATDSTNIQWDCLISQQMKTCTVKIICRKHIYMVAFRQKHHLIVYLI